MDEQQKKPNEPESDTNTSQHHCEDISAALAQSVAQRKELNALRRAQPGETAKLTRNIARNGGPAPAECTATLRRWAVREMIELGAREAEMEAGWKTQREQLAELEREWGFVKEMKDLRERLERLGKEME